ncbi:MAG: hypothetical protein EBS30_18545, partial [Planctomycetes bacterium]|nr:hypothetical protein [Planctomycetota bacterium]
MTFAILVFVLTFIFSVYFTATRLSERPSISLLLMGSLLLIHGLPLLIYLYISGPGGFIYEKALDLVNQEEIVANLLLAMSFVFLGVPAGIRFTHLLWPKQRAAEAHLANWSEGELRHVYHAT